MKSKRAKAKRLFGKERGSKKTLKGEKRLFTGKNRLGGRKG